MKLKSIEFENYKAFQKKQRVAIRPVTVLIGKNSSGKSAIAKLFTLLENSLSGNIDEPLLLVNNGVELGGEFLDLSYGKQPSIPVKFLINFENDVKLEVGIVHDGSGYNLIIFEWSFSSSAFSISLSYSPDKGYSDSNGKIFKCKFKGLVATEIIDDHGINIALNISADFKIEVDYIGPFRILPARQFPLTGRARYRHMGAKGENAYSILGVSKLLKDDLHVNVGNWYERFFDGWRLDIVDTYRPFIQAKLIKNSSEINIVDVGQGMNQALPLIVRAHIHRIGSLIVFEQPELHLHPAAHGDLAELFARSAKTGQQNYLIETHSENIILRLRKLAVENDFGFTNEDIVIYWIDESEGGGQELRELTIDSDGVLSDWPNGVFNEDLIEIQELRRAVKRKKDNDSKI